MNYYDDISSGYNRLYELEQRQKLLAIAYAIDGKIPLNSSMTVLDVGCGTGVSTDFWKNKYGASATGIDPSVGLLSQNTAGISTFVQASAESIPFADYSFDVVCSVTAIQNFTDVLQGLKEMKRVGKKYFILSVLANAKNFTELSNAIHTVFRISFEKNIGKDQLFVYIMQV
jgi:ubiquinone/menaquinone biosynthesis C-methylase UbiE